MLHISFEITCPPPPELLAPPPPPPPLPLFLSSWTASRLIPVARHLLYLKMFQTMPLHVSLICFKLKFLPKNMHVDCIGVELHLPAKLAPIPLTLVNYALLIFATHICQFFSHRSLEKTFAALTTIHTYCKKK